MSPILPPKPPNDEEPLALLRRDYKVKKRIKLREVNM